MDKKYKKYTIDFYQVTKSERINSNCAAITFINTGQTGDKSFYINNDFPLQPKEFIAIEANENELDTTTYTVTFLPGAGAQSCTVVRKYYLDDNN